MWDWSEQAAAAGGGHARTLSPQALPDGTVVLGPLPAGQARAGGQGRGWAWWAAVVPAPRRHLGGPFAGTSVGRGRCDGVRGLLLPACTGHWGAPLPAARITLPAPCGGAPLLPSGSPGGDPAGSSAGQCPLSAGAPRPAAGAQGGPAKCGMGVPSRPGLWPRPSPTAESHPRPMRPVSPKPDLLTLRSLPQRALLVPKPRSVSTPPHVGCPSFPCTFCSHPWHRDQPPSRAQGLTGFMGERVY